MRWSARVIRQMVYAVVLLAVIMGAAYVDWLGLPLLEAYVTFFLTEEIDPGLIMSELEAWLNWEAPSWWPPWEGWFERGNEPPAPDGHVVPREPRRLMVMPT